MKTFFRNLFRMKAAYLLNMVGLTIAFAAFSIIMIQVRHEFSFDTRTPDNERIFRLEVELHENMGAMGEAGRILPIFPRGWAEEIFRSSPLIESGAVIFPFMDLTYVTVETPHGDKGLKVDFEPCSPDIYKTFHFNILEGSADCLENPDQVLIPKSLSLTLFGNESAIGKHIRANEYIYQRESYYVNVGGVYEDFENTQLRNSIYIPIAKSDYSSWDHFNYFAYVKLKSPASAQEVVANYERIKMENELSKITTLRLRPLKDIYFSTDCIYDDRSFHGSRSTTWMLLSIGVLIILLATINFTNFSMALVPFRIRSVNTKKVLGSTPSALRAELVSDAVWTALMASLLAVVLVYAIGQSRLSSIATCSIGVMDNWDILVGMVLLALLVGGIAGFYPARYTTSFSPALVLKGDFGLSKKGLLLRRVLIAVQFVISLSLISFSLLIQRQNKLMLGGDLGFNTNDLYVSEVSSSLDSAQYVSMAGKISQLPFVENVAFAQDKLCSKDNYQRSRFSYEGEYLEATVMYVSWNYLKTIGIQLVDGTYPTQENWVQPVHRVYANKAFADAYNIKPDMMLSTSANSAPQHKVQCITNNPKIFTLKKNPDAAVMVSPGYGATNAFGYLYVRVTPGTDPQAVMAAINPLVQEAEVNYPIGLQPFYTIIEERFQSDKDFEVAIKAFSLLAILISMIGVFGLILFDTQQKRKEIALRRVHGAEGREIMMLFLLPYLRLLGICFILSIPIVVYFGNLWLGLFANHVAISPWIFVVSLVFTLFITLVTILSQVMRAIHNNPVDSIKIE